MRSVVDLLWAERDPARPDYGGWWLFAFPLRELQHYPFPFFVRGDDVFFSLGNRFEIRTMNGIACLGESFRVKHGPLTAYLDGRYHLVHALMRERGRARMLRRLISNQFFKPLLGYHYASARAFTLAMRHVAQGPRFFIENMDLAKVRSQIATWTPSERMQPVPAHGLKIRRMCTGREKPLRALVRMLTLHGLLLPNALFSKRLLVHEKAFFGRSAAVFHFRRVLYEDQATATGYIAEYNRLLFFRELGAFLTVLRLFVSRMPALRREYSVAMERMTSREFWRDLYSIKTEVRGREQKTA